MILFEPENHPAEQQQNFLEFILANDSGIPVESYAEKSGIPAEQLLEWKNDPAFIRKVYETCLLRNKIALPMIINVLLNRIDNDRDIQACKLVLQLLEKDVLIEQEPMSPEMILQLIDNSVANDSESRAEDVKRK